MSKTRTSSSVGEGSTDGFSAVGTTVETFTSRLKRKLKEQETKDDEAQRQTDTRHQLMLKALNTIRKSLGEASKIKLGSRFSFDLDVSDWEGWPRLELNLVDELSPITIKHALCITANDRQNHGTVNIALKSGEILGRVHLHNAEEFDRLPLLLKRSIRHFLDLVAPYVLNPPNPQEMVEEQCKPLETHEPESSCAISDSLSSVDVFTEETWGNDNVIHVRDGA